MNGNEEKTSNSQEETTDSENSLESNSCLKGTFDDKAANQFDHLFSHHFESHNKSVFSGMDNNLNAIGSLSLILEDTRISARTESGSPLSNGSSHESTNLKSVESSVVFEPKVEQQKLSKVFPSTYPPTHEEFFAQGHLPQPFIPGQNRDVSMSSSLHQHVKPRLQPTPYQLQYRNNGVYGNSMDNSSYSQNARKNPYQQQQGCSQQQYSQSMKPMPQAPFRQSTFNPQFVPSPFLASGRATAPLPQRPSPSQFQPPPIPAHPKLPHPPITNEDSIVFMVQYKTEFRYFVGSPYLTEMIKIQDFVVAEAEHKGEDLGLVIEMISMETYIERRLREQRSGQFEEHLRVLRYITRLATPYDIALIPERYHDEEIVLERTRGIVNNILCLPLQIVDAEYQSDRLKLSIHYIATTRVDFRELISKLFALFRTCIWMKKVNTNLIFDANDADKVALKTGVVVRSRQGLAIPSLSQNVFSSMPMYSRQQQEQELYQQEQQHQQLFGLQTFNHDLNFGLQEPIPVMFREGDGYDSA